MKKHFNRLADEKYVRVMADYCSNGIWTKGGGMADLEDLGVCAETIFDIGAWQHWHDARKHDDPVRNIDGFVKFGWRIVWSIVHQHPDWTVLYVDEKTHEYLIGVKLWLVKTS